MEQDHSAQSGPKISWRNGFDADLKKRIISGAILAPLVLAIIAIGSAIYTALIISGAILLSYEWKSLAAKEHNAKARLKLEILGLIYILLPATSLVWLGALTKDGYGISGRCIIFWIVLLVWATDIAGYFAGRHFGGAKLAPAISPNKTWAGFFGGLAAAFVLSLILIFAIHPEHIVAFALLGLATSTVSQSGDLLESWIKRKLGVKDSGNLIPGHGGLFDRVDGLLAAGVFIAAVMAITSGSGIFK